MTPDSQELDVFLRGSRSYVQGSQILGRTADWLLQAGLDGAVLVDAKFSQITDHPVIAFRHADKQPDQAGSPIGRAVYRLGDEKIDVLYADAKAGLAPRIEDQPSKLSSFVDHGDLRGEAHLALDGTQEGYLAAVIETVKTLHQSLASEVTDIWFTALSGAELPIAPGPGSAALIKVEPLLSRNHAGRKQTLSDITICAPECEATRFNIAFSCRIAEA